MPLVEPNQSAGPTAANSAEAPAEGASLATRIEALQTLTEPDLERDLARQLAEVLRRPVKRTSQMSASPTSSADEQPTHAASDAAQTTIAADPEFQDVPSGARKMRRVHVVRRASVTDPPGSVDDNEVTTLADGDIAGPDGKSLPPRAIAWVRTARRQRNRANLTSAASWTISVGVSMVIIFLAGWILLGRPTDIEALIEHTLGMLELG